MVHIQREENKAILDCLSIIAPGVKWNPALASSFERMLLKRGFEISRTLTRSTPTAGEQDE